MTAMDIVCLAAIWLTQFVVFCMGYMWSVGKHGNHPFLHLATMALYFVQMYWVWALPEPGRTLRALIAFVVYGALMALDDLIDRWRDQRHARRAAATPN